MRRAVVSQRLREVDVDEPSRAAPKASGMNWDRLRSHYAGGCHWTGNRSAIDSALVQRKWID